MTTLFLPLAVTAVEPAGEAGLVVEDAAVAVATVTAIDQKTREITLKGPEGDKMTFTAGHDVRNFDQIKRGDRIMMSCFEGFAVALGPKGSGATAEIATLDITRAKAGEKSPG